jgi:ComF family protein
MKQHMSGSIHGAERLQELARGLVDVIFPPHCVACEAPAPSALCGTCRQASWAEEVERAAVVSGLDDVAYVGDHDGPLRTAILALKFHRRVVVAPALGELLAARLATCQPLWQVELIVPVPSHPRRRRERGVNQTLLLARELARRCGLPLETEALRRTRYTVPQTQLRPAERLENLADAFAAVPEQIQGWRVLLVDDVFTTGTTLAACAAALRAAGAAAVYALTLSRGGT